MGKSEGSNAEGKAENVRSRQKTNCGGAAGTVGAGEGAAVESCLEPTEPAASYAAGFRFLRSSAQNPVTLISQSP
jgi:hypothetical protein